MHRIVTLFIEGKTTWSVEELNADPSILAGAREAERLGLVTLLVGPLTKGRYIRDVPLDLRVMALTPAGEAMAAAA